MSAVVRLLESTRKCENCDALQLEATLTDTYPCQVWSRSSYLLLSYNVFTLLYAVTLTFDLW